jgi:hypothetical protein
MIYYTQALSYGTYPAWLHEQWFGIPVLPIVRLFMTPAAPNLIPVGLPQMFAETP